MDLSSNVKHHWKIFGAWGGIRQPAHMAELLLGTSLWSRSLLWRTNINLSAFVTNNMKISYIFTWLCMSIHLPVCEGVEKLIFVVKTAPCHRHVVTTAPCHWCVVTTAPFHRRVVTISPCHRRVVTAAPCHWRVVTTAPCHRSVVTTTPCHWRKYRWYL